MMCCTQGRLKTGNTLQNEYNKQTKPKVLQSEVSPKYTHEEWIQKIKSPIQITSDLSYNLRHNFPPALRSAIWIWLSEKGRLKHLYPKLSIESIDQQSVVREIRKDLHRSHWKKTDYKKANSMDMESNSTSSRQLEVAEQKIEQLCRILIAYSNFDTQTKYVQGMNVIAATILDQIGNEELAFQVMNYILNVQNYRKLFLMDLNCITLLDKRIQYEVPVVYKKMKENSVNSQKCFDYLFFSIFQLSRQQLALRILDVFLLEKESIIQTVLIKILQLQMNEICSQQDQDELIMYLRNEMIEDALDKLDDREDYLSQILSVYI